MTLHPSCLALAATLACTAGVAHAADPAAATSLEDAIAKGKFTLNVRARYEDAEQSPLDAEALTLRTRFGYRTAPYKGFTAYLEAQNNLALVNDYREPGTPPNGHAIVADPQTTEISQAWVGYASADQRSALTLGRQRIVIDNMRFVGDGGWRQNYQTFDAVSFKHRPVAKLDLFYSYLWGVKRLFANPPAVAFQDFDSASHLVNLSYAGLPIGKLTGYAYLLDFDNGPAVSSATYGLSLTGTQTLGAGFTLGYRAEYATQSDHADNPNDYDADYHVGELTAGYQGVSLTLGQEVLGSDGGSVAFQTPLATGHIFNGWADVFLTTPGAGLQDRYIALSAPIGPVRATLRYHQFEAERGGADFGDELDFSAAYKVSERLGLILKIARYDADGFGVDTDRYSVQADYAF